MEIYRCRICSETYLGTRPTDRCPFCGVEEEYFVLTTAYEENRDAPTLSETEKSDVLHAIELERSNARFYHTLGARPDNPMLASAFKRLAAIEAEHCSIFSKLAGIPKPTDLLEPVEMAEEWCDNINESLARELRASTFYAEAAGRAISPHLAEVLLAISAVERDHIELDGVAARMVACDRPIARFKRIADRSMLV